HGTYEFERPLASARLFTAGKDILVRLTDEEQQSFLVAASRGGQQAIAEAFDAVVRAVDYRDDVAVRWKPDPDIEVSPLHQFGAPCVAGTGIQTATLYSFICAGDEPERIAELYEIPLKQVQRAIAWE